MPVARLSDRVERPARVGWSRRRSRWVAPARVVRIMEQARWPGVARSYSREPADRRVVASSCLYRGRDKYWCYSRHHHMILLPPPRQPVPHVRAEASSCSLCSCVLSGRAARRLDAVKTGQGAAGATLVGLSQSSRLCFVRRRRGWPGAQDSGTGVVGGGGGGGGGTVEWACSWARENERRGAGARCGSATRQKGCRKGVSVRWPSYDRRDRMMARDKQRRLKGTRPGGTRKDGRWILVGSLFLLAVPAIT